MVLDNYIKYLYGLTNNTQNNGVRPINTPNMKSLTGKTDVLWPRTNNNYDGLQKLSALIENTDNDYNWCIALGTDTTPVTKGDYQFDHEITTLTYVSYSIGLAEKAGRNVLRLTKTVSNETEEDIVVNEIGVIISQPSQNTSATKMDRMALIAREVLSEQITVKANGGIQVFGIDIG